MGNYWKGRGGFWSPGPLYELSVKVPHGTTQIDSLSSGGQKSGIWALLPPEALEENPFLPLPASSGCGWSVVLLGLRLTCSNLCFSHRMASSLFI